MSTSERTPTKFDGLANLTLLDSDPQTRDELNAIDDPEECFVAAARIARRNKRDNEEMDDLRERRRRALGVLHYNGGWSKMDLLRWITPPGEVRDRRVVDFAIDSIDDQRDLPKVVTEEEIRSRGWDPNNLPDGYWSETYALTEAREANHEYLRRERIATTAREVMKVMIWRMTSEDGPLGRVWTNAELSVMSGYPSARIGQIRKGTTNAWKKAKRAEARAQNPNAGRRRRSRKAAA